MLPIDIIFVRHGQSEGNVANKASRKGDNSFFTPGFRERHSRAFRLTDKGIEQAKSAGLWLKKNIPMPIDRFYVSDYVRAKETAIHLELPSAQWRTEYQLRERDKALMDNCPIDEQKKYFPEVAKFIYKINSIPFQQSDFPFQEPMTSYTKSKKAWRTRIKFILDCRETKTYGQELLAFLPDIESILNKFEDRLQKVLKQVGNSFVFESAHLGHCLKTPAGFRFFNWEQVSYGDPSYTLAVFLTSLRERPDFEEIKESMIDSYLEKKFIPEFFELVEQRITERQISNVIWSAYTSVKKDAKIVSDWYEKVKRIEKIIEQQTL